MLPEFCKQLKLTDQLVSKLHKMNLFTEWDLVLHLPLRYEDETRITSIADAPLGESCQVQGMVVLQEVQFRPRKQLVVRIQDAAGGFLNLRFLHFYPSQQKQMQQGEVIRAFGEVKQGFWGLEMIHPKVKSVRNDMLPENLTPIYPSVKGLNQTTLRKIIGHALNIADLSEVLPENLLHHLNLPHFKECLQFLHQPPREIALSVLNSGELPAVQRLKFDELLAQQLSMRLARKKRYSGQAPILKGDGSLQGKLLNALPFALTNAQQRVLAEIQNDMQQNYPMQRLLQGDVGSGKTIVAALAALAAIESKGDFQVAIMAPTEI